MNPPVLPEGLEYVRTTDVFDNESVPAGLLRAHRVAEGVWGQLVLKSGRVRFIFEDAADDPIIVEDQGSVPIPPGRHHHVEFDGPATFVVEFYRIPENALPTEGRESSGLYGGGD
ncbi:MAG: DUF1971 domain-containing protein [Microthrixaceae bacterium]